MLEHGPAPTAGSRTSLQAPADAAGERLQLPLGRPVAVLASPAQLAPLAWAFAQAAPGARLGLVHARGLPAPGPDVEDAAERVAAASAVRELRARGLLAGQIELGGGDGDAPAEVEGLGGRSAASAAEAIYEGVRSAGFDAVVCGAAPGGRPAARAADGAAVAALAAGSGALELAHAALALGCPTLLLARVDGAAGRARTAGMSAETNTVLELLLEPVTVALPAGLRSPVGGQLRAGLGSVFGGQGAGGAEEPEHERPARITRHDWRRAPVDLPGFAASGLARAASGAAGDPLLFGAALAGGTALAQLFAEAAEQAGG